MVLSNLMERPGGDVAREARGRPGGGDFSMSLASRLSDMGASNAGWGARARSEPGCKAPTHPGNDDRMLLALVPGRSTAICRQSFLGSVGRLFASAFISLSRGGLCKLSSPQGTRVTQDQRPTKGLPSRSAKQPAPCCSTSELVTGSLPSLSRRWAVFDREL